MDINDIRHNYQLKKLASRDLNSSPIEQFRSWFQEAIKSEIFEVNGAALATVGENGRPSCRMVLIKMIEDEGILFFSNYTSRKAEEIEQNPFGAITVWWKELERQVRFEGKIEKTPRAISADYFSKRPRESQVAAWASNQSKPLESREALESAYASYEKEFKEGDVPLPEFWGGYRLIPDRVEFWQGRANRMHDRFIYTKESDEWKTERLYP